MYGCACALFTPMNCMLGRRSSRRAGFFSLKKSALSNFQGSPLTARMHSATIPWNAIELSLDSATARPCVHACVQHCDAVPGPEAVAVPSNPFAKIDLTCSILGLWRFHFIIDSTSSCDQQLKTTTKFNRSTRYLESRRIYFKRWAKTSQNLSPFGKLFSCNRVTFTWPNYSLLWRG